MTGNAGEGGHEGDAMATVLSRIGAADGLAVRPGLPVSAKKIAAPPVKPEMEQVTTAITMRKVRTRLFSLGVSEVN